jgi:hypothetical protein
MAIPTSERAVRQAINTAAVFIFIVFPPSYNLVWHPSIVFEDHNI